LSEEVLTVVKCEVLRGEFLTVNCTRSGGRTTRRRGTT
jgi:hypothetical protein